MDLIDSRYKINRVDLLEVCKEYGTPLYVYDAEKIASQHKRIASAFSGVNLKIKYACKALSNQTILKLMKKLGAGLDAVSIEEVLLGLKAGFSPGEILFTPNGVSFDEIKTGVEKNIVINIDNIGLLEHFGNEYGNRVPCCIRLNPHVEAGGNQHIQTGHIDSKFGISIYQLRHVERVIKTYNIRVTGLHIHTGSEILDSSVFLRVAELMFEEAMNFPDLEFIDFGSGFKVKYKEEDSDTDIAELGKEFTSRFNEFCKQYGRELELWFEPGKFLVSECGLLLVTTNIVKQTLSTVFAGVNSGQNHLIRPMFYDAYHHIINISNPDGKQRIYTVVGYICETDTFGWDRKMNEVHEGDVLAIKNAGAYGFSMSNNYNSRLRPAEVLIYQGKAHLIRKRETMDDLLKNQVEVDL
jgi:diaminopimelate decarboxylase